MSLFSEQPHAEQNAWFEPVFLIAAALLSLVFGFVLGSIEGTMLVAVIPVVLLAVYFGITNPELLAAMLIGITWGYISSILVKFQGTPSIAKPLIAMLIGIILLRRFTGKKTPLVYHPIQWWILAYLVFVTAGMWYAGKPDRTMVVAIEIAKQLVFFYVVINLISSERILETTIWIMVIIGGVLGFFTLYQELTGNFSSDFGGFARSEVAQISEDISNRPRAGGPTSDPNVFGQQLLTLVPLGLWITLSTRSLFARIVGSVCVFMCLVGVGLSFSRGAYLAVGVMFVLLVLHLRLNPRYLLVIPVLWLALAFTPPEIRSRFDTLNSLLPNTGEPVQQDASIRRRSVEMLMAFYMFLDHPVIGVGADNYKTNYPAYIREYGGNVPDEQRNAHSLYLEVAAEGGLIGLFIFGSMLFIAMRSVLQAQKVFVAVGHHRMAELASLLAIGLSGFLVSAIFLHNDYPDFVWTLITLSVACGLVAQRVYQQERGPVTASQASIVPVAGMPEPGM